MQFPLCVSYISSVHGQALEGFGQPLNHVNSYQYVKNDHSTCVLILKENVIVGIKSFERELDSGTAVWESMWEEFLRQKIIYLGVNLLHGF